MKFLNRGDFFFSIQDWIRINFLIENFVLQGTYKNFVFVFLQIDVPCSCNLCHHIVHLFYEHLQSKISAYWQYLMIQLIVSITIKHPVFHRSIYCLIRYNDFIRNESKKIKCHFYFTFYIAAFTEYKIKDYIK